MKTEIEFANIYIEQFKEGFRGVIDLGEVRFNALPAEFALKEAKQ